MREAGKGFVLSCEEDAHYRDSDPQWPKASIHAERGGANERPRILGNEVMDWTGAQRRQDSAIWVDRVCSLTSA